MDAVFVELPPFRSYRSGYLSDESFQELQQQMMQNPEKGDRIRGTGGLRKLRFKDPSRNKGARGGVRVIYYWHVEERQFWLFTIYNKDEMNDLSRDEKQLLKQLLQQQRAKRVGYKR